MPTGVTLLSAFGQFTLFSYFAPYFFQTLGLERCVSIQVATIDMSGSYEKAILEWLYAWNER